MGIVDHTGPYIEQARLVVLEAANKGEVAICALPGYGNHTIRLIAHKDLAVGDVVVPSEGPLAPSYTEEQVREAARSIRTWTGPYADGIIRELLAALMSESAPPQGDPDE